MYILKAGEGCVLKMRLVEANGAPIELRNARFVQAILHLPNEATMLCEYVRFDEVSQLVFVRLSAKDELTMEGVYGININALFDGRVVTSAVLDFAEVKGNTESRYFELLIDLLVSTTDVPSCVKYTGASPKISENGTWLVFNDEINAFEDTGISIFGKSAYQAAIESGNFSGTEEEFNAYMGSIPQITNDAILATDAATQAATAANEAAINANQAAQDAVSIANSKGEEAISRADEKGNTAIQQANQAGAEAVRIATDAATQATTAKENAEQATEQAMGATANANEAAQRANKEVENLRAKADTDGSYPKMSVGFANNLVGRGEATAEEFTYRPTNGFDPIEDDVARITKIKGNSVVWNQRATFRDSWTEKGLTCVKEGNTIHLYGTVTESFDYDEVRLTSHTSIKRDGRKYLVSIDAPTGVTYGITGYSLKNSSPFIWSRNEGTNWSGVIAISAPLGTTIDYTFKKPILVDLTQTFQAGNEPTTVEEFYTRIPSGIDINAYNEREIIDLNIEAIKTIGLNQWDEQWELGTINGGTGKNSFLASSIRSINYIPALPNTEYYFYCGTPCTVVICCYDKEYNFIGNIAWGNSINTIYTTLPNTSYIRFGTYSLKGAYYGDTYKNDICINLSHTGYKNGTYEPYEEFTRELPVIQKYFLDGMKRAGNVYDSIEWDSSKQKWVAIHRVGKRAYVEGDELNTEYITDGVNTNYPLLTPIETDIEDNINLDYDAEDFGTEEALSSVPSAPFRADIIYKFNAVDSIRQNQLNIKELQDLVASLQSQVASLQATNANVEE